MFVIVVIVLGLITPEYNQIQHTISRLAVEEYGWAQTLNFIQFGIAVFVSGLLISHKVMGNKNKSIIGTVFSLSAFMWFIVALFPTDKFEETRIDIRTLSPNGAIHLGIVLLVFLLFPLGVYKLSNALRQEIKLKSLVRFTEICGYSTGALCLVWTYLLFNGILIEYLGLFQRIIAALALFWMMRMLANVKPSN
jgi:hypothetical protein